VEGFYENDIRLVKMYDMQGREISLAWEKHPHGIQVRVLQELAHSVYFVKIILNDNRVYMGRAVHIQY
jgi:hypothetical protein